jgi:hypothetical protein
MWSERVRASVVESVTSAKVGQKESLGKPKLSIDRP